MVQKVTEDFQVVWQDPADGARSWAFDGMHFPRPAPPLTAHLLESMYRDIWNSPAIFLNGYCYTLDSVPPPPTPEVIERGPFQVWENDYVPRIKEACKRLRTADYDSMSAVQLADQLERIIGDAIDAFRYTMVVVFAFMLPTMQLVDFFEKKFGKGGPQLLATLLQGTDNKTAAAGAALADVAQKAAGSPEVISALHEGRYDDLETVAGGAQFPSELRDYLDEYGWRVESWGLAHVPTWAEDSEVPLKLISRYLRDPNLSPDASIERSHEQHRESMRELESRLGPEDLAELKTKLAACAGHVPISEGRAMWQLTIIGSLRVPLLALGRKLVQAGAIDKPNDVFFLDIGELKQAARNPSSSIQETVAIREANLKRWEQLVPPPFVGAPPDMANVPPEAQTVMSKFFGIGVKPSNEKNVVKGNPASRGSARGRARVIRDLTQADRLQKGDVLVCPTTAPPWTPLFAIAAAVVTDTGGILSHSAICAREYGIPCVVGTQTGTNEIPDGAMITVDGEAGVIRIEA